MKNPKIILAVTGGVCALAVLAVAVWAYCAWSAKTAALEGDDEASIEGLEPMLAKADGLLRKKPFPGAATLRDISSNRTQLVTWCEEAQHLASAGDRVYAKTTPAAFKTFIVSDARRLMALPGAANGSLTKKEFTFGPFKEFIAEGRMPSEEKLPELQRRWDDVVSVIETLAVSGIAELTDVAYKSAQAEEAQQQTANKAKKNKRRAAPAKKTAKTDAKSVEPAAFSYVFTFTTKPAGFVKAINALETGSRFIVIDDFSIVRERDQLGETLGADSKKQNETSARSSRRGRRGRAQEVKVEDSNAGKKSAVVTDPVEEAPFKVTLTLTVYDFHSLEEDATKAQDTAAKTEEKK